MSESTEAAGRGETGPASEEHPFLISHDPDDLGFRFANKPSELAGLSDEDLVVLYRKMAFANKHPFDVIVEKELQARLIAALKEFHTASERSSGTIARLTWALIALTLVIVVLTVVLVVLAVTGNG